jgi:PAS domain S-box-containing protein
MANYDSGPVFLVLPEREREVARSAFSAEGLNALSVELNAIAARVEEGIGLEGDILCQEGPEMQSLVLLDADSWDRLRPSLPPAQKHCLFVVLLPADREGGAVAILEQGAFDYLVSEGDLWAGRAAAYFRALVALERRFSGGFYALERRYEDLVHSLPDIVYELDSEGRFSFINNSVRLLGYDPSDLLGKHFSILLNEEDAEAVDRDSVLAAFHGVATGPALSPKLFNERRSMERRTENLEVRLKRKPGAKTDEGDMIVTVISYGEVTSAGEYDARSSDRLFKGSVGVIRDITLRRKSEEMLRKLYQAVDQLSTGILVADRSFRIEYVNPGFFRISGLSPQEVIGSELFSFFDFAPGKAEEIRSLVLEGFDSKAEVRLAQRPPRFNEEGTGVPGPWTSLLASPVRSPSGLVTHATLICEDISSRKAMEDLVGLAKEEAERANAAKSDFLASMSHELKSPVASVLAAARLIEMGGPEPERRAASIIASAQGLLDMLGDILDFVRFETGTGTLRKYSFPLRGFVARTCDPFEKKAQAKGVLLETGLVPDETLRSDPDRLGRAFAAVLDNAVTFTEKGRVRVDATIERREGNVPHLVLAISDSGPGIPPEDQGRIFAPFVQLSSPYTKRGGAGIGLSLARNIVRALGGELRLQSEVGRGSVFTILVPVGEPEPSVENGPARGSPVGGRRSYRLLVVDDNEVNLEYMAVILANAGHRATTASSGAEALGMLETLAPDAVILDIQMPGMSGIELGRKIREYAGGRYDPGLPLVALTAFDPVEVSRSGVDFDAVFSKPVDVPKLLAGLDEAVDAREREGYAALASRGQDFFAALASSEAAMPALLADMRAKLEAGDSEGFRAASRAALVLLSRLGAEKLAFALRRLVLSLSEEDRPLLLCRMDRLEAAWARFISASR